MLPTSSHQNQNPPPAFGIVIYVRRDEEGRVHGRAANLVEICASAPTERELFMKILPLCKAAIRKSLDDGNAEPLLPSLLPPLADEKKTFFPLHL
jgi:hypothetical protein